MNFAKALLGLIHIAPISTSVDPVLGEEGMWLFDYDNHYTFKISETPTDEEIAAFEEWLREVVGIDETPHDKSISDSCPINQNT